MNYLFIGCDQLRFDTLSVNGNEVCQTPNLDRLAAGGTNFTNAHTTAPLCSPARASMFTGNYALTHGMGTNCDMYHVLASELAEPQALLHNRLKEAGYRCGYFGKWHIGTKIGPRDLGFEGMNIPGYGNCKEDPDFRAYLENRDLQYEITDAIYLNPDDNTLAAGVWDGPDESTVEWYLTNRTIHAMDRYRKSGKPFFVTCQYWGPHGPHLPPAGFLGRADREQIEQWESFGEELDHKPRLLQRHRQLYRDSPTEWEGVREIIGRYYDYMMFIDTQIGRLIDFLQESGLYEDTMIVFTTDHGDMQWSHNGMIDKGFMYEEAMHIPMIVRHPRIPGGVRSSALVSNLDIMPTILEDAGLTCSCDGESLFPVLEGRSAGREAFMMEFHGIRFLYTQRAILRSDGMKYIWSPGDFDELYDLNADPAEINNLIADEACSRERDKMIALLKEQVVRYRDPVMDYVYKILGSWESPSGQVDATNSRYNG